MLGLCCCIGFSLIASSGSYSLVVVCGLLGMWDPPGPGIKLMSPALAGGFFITEPPRKFPLRVLTVHAFVIRNLTVYCFYGFLWFLAQKFLGSGRTVSYSCWHPPRKPPHCFCRGWSPGPSTLPGAFFWLLLIVLLWTLIDKLLFFSFCLPAPGLSWGIWDLVPQLGIEPGPLAFGSMES